MQLKVAIKKLLTHKSAGPRKSEIFLTSSMQSSMGCTCRANAKNNGNRFSTWSMDIKTIHECEQSIIAQFIFRL